MLRTSELELLNERLVEEYEITRTEAQFSRKSRKIFNKTRNELGRKYNDN
jgi:hypothetical protein